MGGELREMNANQKYWSHGWCFSLQLRDSWKGMILEWKGLCRTFHPPFYFTLVLFLWCLFNNLYFWSSLPQHQSRVGCQFLHWPETLIFPFFFFLNLCFLVLFSRTSQSRFAPLGGLFKNWDSVRMGEHPQLLQQSLKLLLMRLVQSPGNL